MLFNVNVNLLFPGWPNEYWHRTFYLSESPPRYKLPPSTSPPLKTYITSMFNVRIISEISSVVRVPCTVRKTISESCWWPEVLPQVHFDRCIILNIGLLTAVRIKLIVYVRGSDWSWLVGEVNDIPDSMLCFTSITDHYMWLSLYISSVSQSNTEFRNSELRMFYSMKECTQTLIGATYFPWH